jgi:hypothetical protein
MRYIASACREAPSDPAETAETRKEDQRSLAAELKAAEEEFRTHVAEITARLPEVAKAAEEAPADSPLAQTASHIAGIADRAKLSKLGPYWAAIVLFWLILYVTAGDIAALTLWYMVVGDNFKKKNKDG